MNGMKNGYHKVGRKPLLSYITLSHLILHAPLLCLRSQFKYRQNRFCLSSFRSQQDKYQLSTESMYNTLAAH